MPGIAPSGLRFLNVIDYCAQFLEQAAESNFAAQKIK